ncbi:MAG TPA: GNVR domain-containing protein [Gammaproteobacteria bacterium]|nr:GNVR domain-containing protein [Gammaproteobacteria bacterium]
MTASVFLAALKARFRVFLIALGTTVVATALVSVVLPKEYRATASLVVDLREGQSLGDQRVTIEQPLERLAYLQTQADIIGNERVARRVVDDLGLANDARAQKDFEKAAPQGTIADWLAKRLLGGLDVKTSQSSIIEISFAADDAAYAAKVANGFAKAYIDTMVALRVEPMQNAAEWFKEQLKTLTADLKAAQDKAAEYQRRRGIVSVDESLDTDHAQLATLSSQLLDAEGKARETRGQEQQAQQAVADSNPVQSVPDIQTNDDVRRLSAELADGEAKLLALATRYGVNHPEYRQQLAENRLRRKTLDDKIKELVAATTQSRQRSEQRVTELAGAVAAQRARLLANRGERDELASLTRNVETAQSAYDTAMQRFVISQVDSRANQTNVALLNAAPVPLEPYRPKLGLNLALALIVGVVLGIGLVLLFESSDRRVRSPSDLEFARTAPLLGTLGTWTPSPRPLLQAPGGPGAIPALESGRS